MSLYTDYRPQSFDDVFGQDEAVKLMKAILKQPHKDRPKVFLMEGPAGCGKTTMAMLFANAIGCDTSIAGLDFQVLDSSKDRGIDNIRAIADVMGARPMAKDCDGRVWLFDEAHSLLKASQEAMLKICEDVPPSTYIFIATTEPQALGKALKTRCKTIAIKPMTVAAAYHTILNVANRAGIAVTEDAAKAMASKCDGSARTAIQILENYMLNGGDVEKAISMQIGQGEKLEADTRTLCYHIAKGTVRWDTMVVPFCKNYTGQAEMVRLAVLGYLKACMLGTNDAQQRKRFISIMECFMEPYFGGGTDACLVYSLACACDIQ